jgi:hypothetical protein
MLIITLKKNKRTKYSFIILLYKLGKRRPLRKLGTFFFNFKLNKYILNIDFFFLLYLFNAFGVFFTLNFFKQIYKYTTIFKL